MVTVLPQKPFNVQMFFKPKNGNRFHKVTTVGWKICVRWNDGSKTWIPLNVLKNSQPLLLAEYCKTMKIYNKPAFNWWVAHTLWRKSRLLSKLKAIYHKTNLKSGL